MDQRDRKESFSHEYLDEVKNILVNKGRKAKDSAIEKFKNRLQDWKNEPVSIAITGSSGAGKSTFINVIRGLEDDDDRAAKTDVIECTTEPQDYPHPNIPGLVYVDLPGVGTPKNPRNESFLKKVNFSR